MLKPEKCHFAYKELKFLRHVVNAEGVGVDYFSNSQVPYAEGQERRVKIPQTARVLPTLRRKFRTHSRATNTLGEKLHPFGWEKAQEEVFRELQEHLQSPPLLAHFKENAETEMHTNASDLCLGVVLV